MEHGASLVDVPGRQELDGRGAFELRALQTGRALGRLLVRLRGFVTAARPLEHVAEAHAQPSDVGRRGGRVLEGEPEEARGPVEGQLLRGLLGGALRVLRGARGLARAEQVHRHRFRIGVGPPLERAREPAVVVGRDVGRQLSDDRLADPIVARLDHVVSVPQADVHEAARRQERDQLVGGVAGLARLPNDGGRHGPAAEGDGLEHLPRVVGETRHAQTHHLLERERGPRGLDAHLGDHALQPAHAAGELLHQERASSRLLRDVGGSPPGLFVVEAEESDRQPARSVLVERPDG